MPKAQKSQGQGLANEVFLYMVALSPSVCVRACVRAFFVPARRFVAHVPYLPAQSYFASYSELNNFCRAALYIVNFTNHHVRIPLGTYL